jgi:hypothetical protein
MLATAIHHGEGGLPALVVLWRLGAVVYGFAVLFSALSYELEIER